MFNPVGALFRWVGEWLADRGLIDAERARRIADLAWPRFLTMFARRSQRVADIAMVGLSIGPAAIAGLAFATVFWRTAISPVLGLVGGTISLASQRYGAERYDELDLVVKQSVWLGLLLVAPTVVVYWIFAEELIGLLAADPASVYHGAAYLRYVAPALVFTALNLIASRTLAGADDTWIAMTVRATGSAANIVFNAVFIFGLGMGAAGAALGTLLAEAMISTFFAWGFLAGSLPLVGEFPVQLSLRRPYVDLGLSRQLVTITPPLVGVKLGQSAVGFPLFAILAFFGPTVVAAFEVGRRVRQVLAAFGSGFSMSTSSLVGQELGRHDEAEADAYGRDSLRFSAVVYVIAAGAVFVAAPLVARLFTSDPSVIGETVPFVRAAAVSFVGYGLFWSYEGVLKGAGDNRWSMYGRLFGLYVALVPLVYIGTVTPLGLLAVYLALVAETWSGALIAGYRVASGRWKVVSRAYRPEAPGD